MELINVTLAICSLLNLAIILVVYFSKPLVKTYEVSKFKVMLVLSLFLPIIEMITYYFKLHGADANSFVYIFMNKAILIGYCLWVLTYLSYIILLTYDGRVTADIKKKNDIIFFLLYLGVTTFLTFTKLDFIAKDNLIIPFGFPVFVLYFICLLCHVMGLVCFIGRRKKIKNRKAIYVYSYLLAGTLIIGTIQFINPQCLFMTALISYGTFIMYFTIENPDVKMLEEFKKSKDRAELANREKEVFLYNITQDIREPLYDIRKATEFMYDRSDEMNKEAVMDASVYINSKTNRLFQQVNDVLDVRNMELTKIKVYNTKYNLKNLLKYIEKTYKSNELIEFRYEVDSNVPETLYGDTLRLKQVIETVIENAYKYTEEGYVSFKLNTVISKNICRLIITIEDTGVGIKASEIDEIFDKEKNVYSHINEIDDLKKNLAMAKTIMDIMEGKLLIDSELGSGTKVTLVLDQKINDNRSEELKKLEDDTDKFVSKTKVMFISEDSEYLEKSIRKLKKYDIELISYDLATKCLEDIRNNKKANVIIIDEALTHLSSIEILNKLKEIHNFEIPVCILTNNKENQRFKKVGFNYVLDRKLLKKEIEDLIFEVE